MKTSAKGLAFLASLEGIVLGPYKDSVGVWTYGIGHTKAAGSPNPELMQRGELGDVKDAVEVFKRDIEKYEAAVSSAVKVPVSQTEFDALVSFHYSTGAIARAKLTAALNGENRPLTVNGFMGWTKPSEIIPRRRKEQILFRDGFYSPGGIPIYTPNSNGGYVKTGEISQAEFAGMAADRASNPSLQWIIDLLFGWAKK